ncbi:PP2C-like domain-containing protein CG9801 isoform X2 [Agrilus planipennis]|uniref:PP2C-like domain-containing protein CG9801 isoform X2 n=1 Tax=Agrilus planipennis TaxID=224129 RepID=A0A1W4X433_AGRPL|nr:PP2C-like domain-containing protein CG9801 isoform X2 [Agrilus planipennis]
MPSLRKRVSSYFRQLSFINEPKERKTNFDENSMVNKYLQGHIKLKDGPQILYGKNPTDLPNFDLGNYNKGSESILGCYSGPNGGLTTVKRTEKHLSMPDDDIDFIDTQEETNTEINSDTRNSPTITIDDSKLPNEWNKKSDFVYGLSDSLYDRNQVTKSKNGDPIADCFGIIARQDSAILAVADGVNWGEKACIAAKSAVHGCLHYLNKTIFNDTKPFVNLTIKDDDQTSETDSDKTKTAETSHISNTREVFVCLLRAFNCAHDLILENQGMLTTLTVAVVLPLKQKNVKKSEAREISKGENRNESFKRNTHRTGSNIVNNNNKEEVENYVCCVCNVGDTLAYVYSQKYGVRELTKGSHDINCNRDMRDALGALGPVDGINPELSNLTLSITTLQKGDLIFVASDGLTDNFDPIVCKFAVNTKTSDASKTKKHAGNDPRPSDHISTQKPTERKDVQRTHSKSPQRSLLHKKKEGSEQTQTQGQSALKNHEDVPAVKTKAPQKPPRKNREKLSQERISSSRQSVSSERSLTSSVSESQKSYDESQKKSETKDEFENPLIAQFMRENSLEEKSTVGTTKTMPIVQQQQPKRDFSSHTPSSSSQHKKISSSSSTETGGVSITISSSSRKGTQQGVTGSTGLQKSQTTKDVRSAAAGNKTIGFSFSNSRPKPEKSTTAIAENPKYRFLRSKTSIDMRPTTKPILRNDEGLPYVSPVQRYELTLLMMEDIVRRGISGHDSGCVTARKLCENLINFTLSITSGKRHTLEDVDLYYNNVNGVLVEVSSTEKKVRRRKALDRVQNLPGKLDHVSIVAYNVGASGI